MGGFRVDRGYNAVGGLILVFFFSRSGQPNLGEPQSYSPESPKRGGSEYWGSLYRGASQVAWMEWWTQARGVALCRSASTKEVDHCQCFYRSVKETRGADMASGYVCVCFHRRQDGRWLPMGERNVKYNIKRKQGPCLGHGGVCLVRRRWITVNGCYGLWTPKQKDGQ